jgi:hypothetical protein
MLLTFSALVGPVPWPNFSVLSCGYVKITNGPPLTVLVVNQETGLPGEGLSTLEEVNEDREAVFDFDWFGLEPPQNQDFKEADRNKA